MRIEGQSSNVEDRRGSRVTRGAVGGAVDDRARRVPSAPDAAGGERGERLGLGGDPGQAIAQEGQPDAGPGEDVNRY